MASNSIDGALLSSEPDEIETGSGLFVSLLDPQVDQINLTDICLGLGQECRYGSQPRRHWSVAAHSLLVQHLTFHVLELPAYSHVGEAEGRAIALHALFHDAPEAYLKDIPSPLKYALRKIEGRGQMSAYDVLTGRMERVICEALGLDQDMLEHPAIKLADLWSLKLEAKVLMTSQGSNWRWPGALPEKDEEQCAGAIMAVLLEQSGQDQGTTWLQMLQLEGGRMKELCKKHTLEGISRTMDSM